MQLHGILNEKCLRRASAFLTYPLRYPLGVSAFGSVQHHSELLSGRM